MTTENNFIELADRKIDQHGNVIIGVELLEEILSENGFISTLQVDMNPEIEKFNFMMKKFGFDESIKPYNPLKTNIGDFHRERSETWFIPDKYMCIDIKKYVLSKCKNKDEVARVEEEWKLYEERNLILLLRWIYYIVECFRENNVVMGVGRGSSVSSFILYILGVHKIDSLKWGLDPKEFLK